MSNIKTIVTSVAIAIGMFRIIANSKAEYYISRVYYVTT